MKDIKIQVPNGYLDIDTNIGFGVTYSIDDVKGLQKKNTSFSKTITLLGTKNNAILMGQLFDVKSDFSQFNPNFKTPAKIIVDSTTIIDGYMQLKNIKKLGNTDFEGNLIQYEVVIFSNVIDFYTKIGDALLTDLNFSGYNHTYTQSNIAATWSNTSGYTYPLMYKGTDTYITNDFKPAIFYKTYLQEIADATGFELGGSFLNNASFVKEIIPFNGPLINLPDSEWERRAFRVGMSGASQTLTSDLKLMGGVYATTTLGTATNTNASLATAYTGITSLNDEVTPPNQDANNHWDTSTDKWTVDAIGKYNIQGRFNIKTTYRTYRDDIVSITGTGGSFIIVTFASPHNFVPSSTPVVTISGASAYNGTYAGAFIYDTNSQLPTQIRINGITHTGDTGSGGRFSWNTYNTGYRLNGGIESQNTNNITWQYLNNVGIFKNGLQLATFTYTNAVPKSTGTSPTFFSGNSWTQTTNVPIQINYPNQQYFVGDEITFKANQQNTTNFSLLKYAESAVASGYDSVPVYVDFELVPANGAADTYVGITAIKQDDLQDGDNLIMANYIPAKVKQKDLIDDLIKRYNLYSTVDPTNANKVILETRDDFYAQSNVVDWTNLKDYSFEDKIQFLSELQNKEVTFTYKKDTDIWNKNYTLATGGEEDGDIYGQKTIEFDNEFTFAKNKIETSFSPTPSIPNSVNNRFIVPAIYTSQPKTNIRTLLYNGLKDPLNTSGGAGVYSWYWEWYSTGSTLNTTYYYQYPQALHQDDISNPTMDINWGEVPYQYGVSSATTVYTTSNNLYNHYWKNYMEQISEGRLVTMRFYLDEVTVSAVKDKLYSKIFVRDSYYYINKIVDFDPTNDDTTEVELLKINDGIPFVSESSTATTISDYEAFRQSNYPPEDLTNVNLSRNAQIYGTNNFVGEDVYGQVIGDNNNITNFRGIVVGSEITDTDGIDGGIILENAYIDSNGQIFNLSGESVSNNFCESGLTTSVITSCDGGNMTIGGGIGWTGNEYSNINTGDYSSVILGGFANSNSGQYGATVVGGHYNTAAGNYGTSVFGGNNNAASAYASVVIGGANNSTTENWSAVIGGQYNNASNESSAVIGGKLNTASGYYSAVIGGGSNTASNYSSSVVGGNINSASGSVSFIGGGDNNVASGPNTAVIGGSVNVIGTGTTTSVIIGGLGNDINDDVEYSVIVGGNNNTASVSNTVYVPALNIQAGYGISFGTGSTRIFKEMLIGDWDMDATTTLNLAHSLSATEWKTLRNVSVIIRNDGDTAYTDFGSYLDSTSDGNTIEINSTNISLTRGLGGLYDNTNWNSTSYNRGWVTFWYTPD